jgi:hypothetical protein
MAAQTAPSVSSQRIATYREFWKFYVSEHSNPVSRILHFIGSGLAILLLLISPIVGFRILWALPVVGYGFAWMGHFRFEKNRPASFKYPFWSLISDFKMFGMILSGKMNAEVEKYGGAPLVDRRQ